MDTFISNQSLLTLFLIFAVALWVLTLATDFLVDHSAALSRDFGISEIIIGATIVSFGTTLPELSSTVIAVLDGHPDFALGNTVGSVITNTTLILGIGALVGSVPVLRSIANRLLFLIGALLLLVFGSIQTFNRELFSSSGNISPFMGLIFLLLLPVYLFVSFKSMEATSETKEEEKKENTSIKELAKQAIIILTSAIIVAFSASILVSTVETAATRIGISEAIIAGTVVALGTSLPELSTTYTSAKKGLGGLAMGNILGANILNILFVLGVSVVLTPSGLTVAPIFYQLHFPIAFAVVGLLCYFVFNTQKHEISKREGVTLLVIYFVYLLFNIFS